MATSLLSFIDIPSVAHPQDYNLVIIKVKDDPIMSDPESIRTKSGFCKVCRIF
ncbi:MAG: hypothetical protein PHR03_07070 [Desulfovibrionales bacterium]|nr:hypothetical protein [Desulfovibrionales bacterium]